MQIAVRTCVRFIAAVLVLTTPAYAATIYVSPTGSDGNPGTLTAPLATPARALQIASAGDTVLLRAGTYQIAATLQIHQRGLRFASYPGERGKIVGDTAETAGITSVLVVYAGNVTVENVELQGSAYYGIKLDDSYGPQSGIVIRGVYIHHTGRDGIKVQQADNLLIEKSEIAFTGVRDSTNADGIDIMGSHVATVRGNYLHDIATTGIYIKAGTRQGSIEGNRVERTGYSGILLGSESLAQYMRDGAIYEAMDSVARNNIVIDARLTGLGSIAGDNVRFENNTVINAASGGQAVFRTAANEYRTGTRNVLLRNNVFVLAPGSTRPMVHLNNYSGAISSEANLWFSADGRYGFWRDGGSTSNYWSSLEAWRSGMNADWTSKKEDPQLDAAALYRARTGSPVVDGGELLTSVSVDFSGTSRPQGVTHDIGAHESAALASPTPTEPTPTPTEPKPTEPPPAVPTAPTGLSAATPARLTVSLAWTDTSTVEGGFRIERAERGAFVVIATIAANSQAYTDNSVKANKTYTYRVVAFNVSGSSGYSNTASATATR